MVKKIYIVLLFFFASCFSSQDISTTNLSSVYRSTDQVYHPEFYLYRFAKDSVRLYVKFNTKDLLYVHQGEGVFTASFKIVCRLLDSYESPVANDTATKIFSIPKPPDDNAVKIFTMEFGLPKEQTYLAEITLMDVKKNTSGIYFLGMDALIPQSRNSFLVTRAFTGLPLFQNYINATDTFQVVYRDPEVKKVYVKYYHRDFPLAAPPFGFDVNSSFDYRFDSLFTVTMGEPVNFPAEGFYQFLVDTFKNEGYTLFRFSKGFPSVVQPTQMIESARYLVSKREYDEFKIATDKKAAIDKFWAVTGGNQERTRLLIKKYYGRVQEANRLFSSYTEGWRTDRGMIFIVFGAPHIVYRSSVNESWVYGQAGNPISLNFSFNKVNNPFTDNDYTLSRAPVYEANWHQAVDVWRQGRVYNDYN